jgi:hypothetical protein
MIWQTTANELQTKEYEEILRKRITLRRLPSAIDKTINQSIDPIQLLLANPILNKDRRASLISACSKTITQYKSWSGKSQTGTSFNCWMSKF